jgi:Bacterial conjugation TrbI-like protein
MFKLRSTHIIVAAAFLLLAVGSFFVLVKPGGQRQFERRTQELSDGVSHLAQPAISQKRNFVPLEGEIRPRRDDNGVIIQTEPRRQNSREQLEYQSLTLVSAEPQASPEPAAPAKGPHAPAFRLLRAQLVNTVDSNNIATPIIGIVTQEFARNGVTIVPRGTEVHGQAQLDASRERIASRGDFTLVFNDRSNPKINDKELVVSGQVLDADYDPEFETFGITDGSAGLRGDVIRTANMDEIKLFVASALSNLAQTAGSGSTGVFGNRLYTNSNSIGTSAIQNLAVTPAANGTASVLDLYARQIYEAIERDGFFIRVPAGKEFYLYVTEDIDLARATDEGDKTRIDRDEREWRLRANRHSVASASANQIIGNNGGVVPAQSEEPYVLPPPDSVPNPLERQSNNSTRIEVPLQFASPAGTPVGPAQAVLPQQMDPAAIAAQIRN